MRKGEVVARNIREKEDGVAPYPTLALDSTWRISKRWSFNARAQTFTAHLSRFHWLALGLSRGYSVPVAP